MTNAPERLWLATLGEDRAVCICHKPMAVEYVRADIIEKLEADNKGLRHMILDQINSTGDDPEIMAATRAEWAARAKDAEAKLAKAVELEAVKILVKSAYKEGWADGDEFISLDVAWEKSLSRTALAELKGDSDE